MPEIKWTASQLSAIKVRANKILVSAAAGSGKSTVLTERIITRVTATDDPFDISKLLVVTFTRAASEELKSKIERALRSAVEMSPDNKRLKEQLLRLPSAQISTIHGLCLSLIKENFHALGLTASIRVADETEANAIRAEVMDELLEAAYSGLFSPIPDFATFAENFISDRDDRLSDIFLSIYDSIKNQPSGFEDWEKNSEAMQRGELSQNDPFSVLLCNKVLMLCDYFIGLYRTAIDYFETEEKYSKACTPVFRKELEFIIRLKDSAASRDYRRVRETLSQKENTRIGIVKAEYKTDEGEFYKENVRGYANKKISELCEKYFCFSDDDIKYLRDKTVSISHGLIAFLREFDHRFSAFKAFRGVLDYNDLEHYALRLLYLPDGSLSPLAYRLSENYNEIYVDEYQDVNPLQNKIFEALSVKSPIFMVGDIKQSIYAFRGAMPSIFSEYRRAFREYSGQPCIDTIFDNAAVFLSENFRSEKAVAEFVNTVSDALFYNPETEPAFYYRIPYSKKDRLICGKAISPNALEVSILIAELSDKDSEEAGYSEGAGIPENAGSYYLEAEMTANKIADLINSGVSPSDIAVLLRSTRSAAPVFEAALRSRSVPVSSDKGSALFDNPEIQLALCLLNCVDNPYRDVFLAGALRSPAFGFTMNELIRIRTEFPDIPLFDALIKYTEAYEYAKGSRFLSFFNSIRAFAAGNTVDKVLWQIYTETSFFSIIYDKPDIVESTVSIRRSNLIMLYNLAHDFTASGRSGIYPFLERVRHIIESGSSPAGASPESAGVRIMSIHQSKGLEFEHCFLCGTSHKFNRDDLKKAVIIEPEFGAAMRIKDDLRLTASDSPYRLALAGLTELYQTDEEMRVLYVALTRAKSALYICASLKDYEKTDRACRFFAASGHPMNFITKNCYLEWILTALRRPTELFPKYSINVYNASDIINKYISVSLTDNKSGKQISDEYDYNKVYKLLDEKFSYVYPHNLSAAIPAKFSVSRLYPEILDDYADAAEMSKFKDILNISGASLPEMLQASETDNSSLMKTPLFSDPDTAFTQAEAGIATHVFMQFCDFDNIVENGVENEISRLIEKRFILPLHADLIDRMAINSFLSSEIFEEMRNSVACQREYRFNIKFPASDFTSDNNLKTILKDDFIFVQGVIDCYFTDINGDIVLLDYKTDRVPFKIKGNITSENDFFIKRHAPQLLYYRKALTRLTGRNIKRTVIYSFSLGRCIEVQ